MDRQHILDEISRTAAANGGKALGRSRFYNETGIKESDWIGKFWVRWSDAVREAGCVPNTLQTPLDESLILERYMVLAREVGNLPVVAELKMKAKQDPTFPSHNTFLRLGKRHEAAQRIVDFASGNADWADVHQIALSVLDKMPTPSGSIVPGEELAEKTGFVYLLKGGRYYKIGRSNSFERRSRELAIQLPERAETVHVIRTDDAIGVEAYWHRRFQLKRKNGEWFEHNAQDIKAFRRRKFM